MMSVSLDGFMEGPDRSIDWHLVDAELHAHLNEWLSAAGAFLDGRVTWELMAGFWPTADRDPAATPTVVEFARIWREMPKIVYSRTLDPGALAWNTTLARSVAVSDVERLKTAAGFQTDGIIAGVDVATFDADIFAGINVNAIATAIDAHICYHDISAISRVCGPIAALRDGESFPADVVA